MPPPADPFGEPDGHRASACPDLKASPTRLNQGTPLARERVEDAFQESQPFVFSLLATSRGQSVTRVEIERLLALHRVSVPHKCWLWKAMDHRSRFGRGKASSRHKCVPILSRCCRGHLRSPGSREQGASSRAYAGAKLG